ncbi:3-phosphoshikimate 1-carboxyvinyltransferase [Nesterenkonia salmonea]|uniref:3-phosphoshikimate 1-carboxyvinyltransferase n=1 Tax=Nesterenkonia salmonea TaxID=1804987 RepID=A0A5R9B868_9MICC|nr:3-phosphoshikimate 1-carboxyvinyltransferase [Nesterenkonia salmonea]TLP94064.1 3-phosphoshikimate 1-carboxyvinyltransferase [Nesterenkonia salmonea]
MNETPQGHPTGWPAPSADSPVVGEVTVPASKSLTNRYLLLAALAEAPSVVVNPLASRDSALMLSALHALGAQVEAITDWEGSGEDAVRVTPLTRGSEPVTVDCGLAGTVMRFLPAVAALSPGRVQFDGDPEAKVRPMGAVLEGLRALGVRITEGGTPGHLPFTVDSAQGLEGGEVTIDASQSSQFVSGLLLAAPRMSAGLTLHHSGTQVPSLEHVEMTLKVLADLGVEVSSPTPFTWRVEPGPIPPFTVRVEPDLSNAGPFLCAAAVTGGGVTMPGWPLESTQIGRRWPQLLTDFGCQVTLTPTSEMSGSLTVKGPERLTSPGTVDGTAELTPTVAALAALCSEETKFTSVGHLRGHETNRIAALVNEVRRLGGAAEETDDGFRLLSRVKRGDVVLSYADHRMATFGAVLGLAIPGVVVEDIGSTAKTMPDFPDRWSALVEA